MPAPAEWRDRLVHQLDARWSKLKVFDAYYEGDQTLRYMTNKYRAAYGGLFKELADNWMQIVVDASVERMKVQGFRFGDTQEADDDAWKIWQANGLDGESNMLHTEAVKLGNAYWMVQPPKEGQEPRITAEHPSQVIVATDPSDRRIRTAALKKWADEEFIYANVYLPDRYVKYRTTQRLIQTTTFRDAKRWETVGSGSNPLGEVPIIPAPNNPSMLHGGRSDLAGGAVRIQDAINQLLGNMLIGAEFLAYPLRVLLGVDIPRGPDGNPVANAELSASQSHLWVFPGDAQTMDIKEFSAGELDNFRQAIDGLVRDLTAQTRTPPHYVSGQIVNASGDALKAAETGLVAKVRDKMEPFGEAHEAVLRLAFKAKDSSDERATETGAETIWADPESRSDAEKADAVAKLFAVGVPWEQCMEDLGYSPQQIDRMSAMRETDALLAETLAPVQQSQNGASPTEPAPTLTPTENAPAAR